MDLFIQIEKQQRHSDYPVVPVRKGDRIVLSHAEVLDADGNFYNANYRNAKARLEYICRDGHQCYKPFFTYFGFRYIRIDEYSGARI